MLELVHLLVTTCVLIIVTQALLKFMLYRIDNEFDHIRNKWKCPAGGKNRRRISMMAAPNIKTTPQLPRAAQGLLDPLLAGATLTWTPDRGFRCTLANGKNDRCACQLFGLGGAPA